VSFDVTPQFVVDLAYRYADLGNASSGVVTAMTTRARTAASISAMSSNDLLLGVRYGCSASNPLCMR
jgi:opacity protein-like surface antigen